jgi:hypothetical protein
LHRGSPAPIAFGEDHAKQDIKERKDILGNAFFTFIAVFACRAI